MKTLSLIGITLSLLSHTPIAQAHQDGECEANNFEKYYFCSSKCGSSGYGANKVLVANLYSSRGQLIHTSCRVLKSDTECYRTADSLNSKQ